MNDLRTLAMYNGDVKVVLVGVLGAVLRRVCELGAKLCVDREGCGALLIGQMTMFNETRKTLLVYGETPYRLLPVKYLV